MLAAAVTLADSGGERPEETHMSSIVIRGGSVIDGTGAPRREADVLVRDGRIAEIGSGLSGDRELDASGAVMTPGFRVEVVGV